jgi:hypothetical protein
MNRCTTVSVLLDCILCFAAHSSSIRMTRSLASISIMSGRCGQVRRLTPTPLSKVWGRPSHEQVLVMAGDNCPLLYGIVDRYSSQRKAWKVFNTNRTLAERIGHPSSFPGEVPRSSTPSMESRTADQAVPETASPKPPAPKMENTGKSQHLCGANERLPRCNAAEQKALCPWKHEGSLPCLIVPQRPARCRSASSRPSWQPRGWIAPRRSTRQTLSSWLSAISSLKRYPACWRAKQVGTL